MKLQNINNKKKNIYETSKQKQKKAFTNRSKAYRMDNGHAVK